MTYNPFTLTGKRILVTGASSGIGKATAIEASNLGASLIITGRNETKLKETLSELNGDSHSAIITDLSTTSGIENLLFSLPKIDGLVLSAGIDKIKTLQFSKIELFEEIFTINLYSQFELLRLIVKKKLYNKGFSVVAISSVAAFMPSIAHGVYGAGKAALISVMKCAALELAPKDIRVNLISPGALKTPMNSVNNMLTDEQLKEYEQKYPLKKLGSTEDIAYGCIYLLSDAAKWLTGTNLIIDGGITLVS